MKIAVLTAMLAGFFAAVGGLHANERTDAIAHVSGSCIVNCQTQEAHCRQFSKSPDCEDQYAACVERCASLPN